MFSLLAYCKSKTFHKSHIEAISILGRVVGNMSGRHRQKRKFGGRGGGRGRGGGHGGRGDGGGGIRDDRGGYKLLPKENQIFEKYYKESGLVPDGEWDAFLETLRKPLPSTFRVTGCKSESSELLKIIKTDYLSKVSGVEVDGRPIDPPSCLSWYPDELAWQINLDRKLIRTCDTLKDLHQFLIQETESGNISRQEAVSMIPPLVLDVKPHHKVFDMCAAPGSKTTQLIEMLHQDETIPVPDGVVVANDSDNKRCYLMVHQVKRMESPCFIVVNHDASQMPNFYINPPDKEKKVLKFDRILADVPCSGDGTLRKNIDAWYKWNPSSPCHLHNLQGRILRRGLEMLEVGGRLVYSTCSMNPVEDEAVVANMINQAKGSVRLVDVSNSVPGLKYTKGVSSWRVMTREQTWLNSFEEVPERMAAQLRPSMFPPNEAQSMNLHRCMRVLPHLQNTGGFFVAVLEKTQPLPWSSSKTASIESSSDRTEDGVLAESDEVDSPCDPEHEPPFKRQKHRGYKEDPFLFLEKDDPLWPPVSEFYGVPDFPMDQLLVRCSEGKKRNVYFASRLVRDILQFNLERFKFINLGLKLVARSESKYTSCKFRPVQDGIGTLFPFMKKRIITVMKEDVITILSSDNPFTTRLTKTTQNQLEGFEQGGCVFVYEPEDSPDSPQCRLVICGWIGMVSCRSFLARNDRGHFLRLCGARLKTKEEILAEKAEKKAQEDDSYDDDGNDEATESTVDAAAVQSSHSDELTKNSEEDLPEQTTQMEGVEMTEAGDIKSENVS